MVLDWRLAWFDGKGFSVNESVRNFAPCSLQDSTHRGARDSHLVRRADLVQAFCVHEPNRFQFIEMDLGGPEATTGNARGLE